MYCSRHAKAKQPKGAVLLYNLKRYVVQYIQYRDISCFREEEKKIFQVWENSPTQVVRYGDISGTR